MGMYKQTENLEFDVLYADGTKRHVEKGVLFEEAPDNTLHMHIGTDNQYNLFMAIVHDICMMISGMTKGKIKVQITEDKGEEECNTHKSH